MVVPAGSLGIVRGSPVDLIRQAPRMRKRFTQVNVFSTDPLGGKPRLALISFCAMRVLSRLTGLLKG